MTSYVRIASVDMHGDKPINEAPNVHELLHPFAQNERGDIDLAIGVEVWRLDGLLRTLIAFQDGGVRGSVQVIDDYPSWTKYVLTEHCVECYTSDVVYRSEPYRTLKSVDDIAGMAPHEADME